MLTFFANDNFLYNIVSELKLGNYYIRDHNYNFGKKRIMTLAIKLLEPYMSDVSEIIDILFIQKVQPDKNNYGTEKIEEIFDLYQELKSGTNKTYIHSLIKNNISSNIPILYFV